MLNLDGIRQATRLTRAGQFVEATALLQRMLRGDRMPDAPSRPEERIALAGREPLTIDAKANAVGGRIVLSNRSQPPHNRARFARH